jgi:hypothetical protein
MRQNEQSKVIWLEGIYEIKYDQSKKVPAVYLSASVCHNKKSFCLEHILSHRDTYSYTLEGFRAAAGAGALMFIAPVGGGLFSGCPNQEVVRTCVIEGLVIRTCSYFGADFTTLNPKKCAW